MHPLNGKIFPNEKPPHSFGQRVPKCTPIFGLSSKNFLRKFIPSLIPTGSVQMHTLNRKKFLPLHLFGIERSKRNLFFRKKAKIFLKRRFVSKHPLTCSHWKRIFGDSNLEKRQKNLPSNIGGHTFDTNNIIDFLKYSERIHIG